MYPERDSKIYKKDSIPGSARFEMKITLQSYLVKRSTSLGKSWCFPETRGKYVVSACIFDGDEDSIYSLNIQSCSVSEVLAYRDECTYKIK